MDATIQLPRGSRPYGVVAAPTGGYLYVTLEATGQLLKLDSTDGSQVGSADVGRNVRHVAVSADGSRVYVSRFITPKLPGEETADVQTTDVGGEVLVINPATMSTLDTILLQVNSDSDFEAGARGVPNYLGAPVISPDGRTAWVPSKQDNILRGGLRDGNSMNFEHTVRAISSKIDLESQSEIFRNRIDHDDSSLASAAAFGPYGNHLFVALETSREISILDSYSGQEVRRFDVGRAPQGIAVSSDGSKLFVHNFMDRSIGVYDITDLINTGNLSVPNLVTHDAVASETLTLDVLNGKQLFYDAADERLTQDSYMSCASCHNDGGHDGRIWDFTGSGEGLRNTISLQGHGGPDHGRLHWSGNFDEVHDFENQIRSLAGGTGLMSNDDFNATQEPFGTSKAGRSAELDALAAYVNSLTTAPPSPHRNSDGTLTNDASAGKQLFEAKGCASCHAGPQYTDSASGVAHDVGTIKPSSGQRLGASLSGIDTPTLLGVWDTAPYLHDGSAATLADAVNAHQSVTLSLPELSQLVAYLNQIDETHSETAPLAIDGQIGHWPFDTDATDSLGAADGLLVNGATLASDGQRGAVLSLDGIDDYVSIPLNVPEGAGSVSLWFKTSDDNRGIFSVVKDELGLSNDRHIYLLDGDLRSRLWNNQTIATSGQSYADGEWHHVVYVHGADVGGQKLYVDGVEVAAGNKASSDFTGQDRLHFGYSRDAAIDFFKGQLDDLRYFDRALGANDVMTLFSAAGVSTANQQPQRPIPQTIGSKPERVFIPFLSR